MPTKKKRVSKKKTAVLSKRVESPLALENNATFSDEEEDDDLVKNNESGDERASKKVKTDSSDDHPIREELQHEEEEEEDDTESDQQKSSDNEEDEEYMDEDFDDIDWSNKDVISKLDISVVQREAKRRGLSIKGNRKAVMNRILDSFIDQSQVPVSSDTSDNPVTPIVLTPKKGVLKTPEQVFSNSYTPSKKSQGKRERAFEIDDPESWTLAELRHYLKSVYNIRAYDNKQKILARYLDQIKHTLALSRSGEDGTEIDISQIISKSTKNSKQRTPKTPKTKEVVEPKKITTRTPRFPRREYVESDEPVSLYENEESSHNKLKSHVEYIEMIRYEERGPLKERIMPSYAQPNIHRSFEMSYNRKRIQIDVDTTQIDPYFSQITSSYNHITYEYPSQKIEPHEVPVSDRIIKDNLLEKIIQEQVEKTESQDLTQISSLEYELDKDESGDDTKVISTLYGIDKCKSLQKLTIQGNHLSALYPISKLENLKEIHLSRNRITNLQYLPPNVEIVNLSFNLLKSLRMPTSVYNSLVYLNMSYNQLDVNIESICYLNNLEELDLSGNCLTDEMIQPIEKANFKKSLKSLRMNDNYITDLSCMMDFNLIELSCGSNFVFDLTPLSSLRCLSEAFFDNNPPLLLSLHISLETVDLKSVNLDENLLEDFKLTGESNLRLISLLLKENEDFSLITTETGLVFKSDLNNEVIKGLSQLNSYYIKKADISNIEENGNSAIILLSGDGKLLKLTHEDSSNQFRQIVIHDESNREKVVTKEAKKSFEAQFKLHHLDHFYFNEGKITQDVVVKDIIVGKRHGVILTDDGKCFSWGFNYFGCLGHDHYSNIVDNHQQTSTNGDVSETVSYSEKPYFIQTLSKFTIKHVSVGDEHTVCCTDDGRVFSFGRNNFGQLGTGDLIDRYYASPVTKLMKRKIESSSCGSQFSLTLTEDGLIFGFGKPSNICQQDTMDCTNPVHLDVFRSHAIDSIHCGSEYSVAMSRSKDVYLWGEYLEGKILLEPIIITKLLPTDQILSSISCCNNVLFFSTSNNLSSKDQLVNSIRDLEMNVKKEAIILKERSQHLTTIAKELERNTEESKESIIALCVSYMNLVNNRSDSAFTTLLGKSKEIYNSLIFYSGDMTEINHSLLLLNLQIKDWNKQKQELTFVLTILMKKYETFTNNSLNQTENEKNMRSSLQKIFVHSSSNETEDGSFTKSLDKIYSLHDKEDNDANAMLEEALNLEMHEDLDFDQFDKEIEMEAKNYTPDNFEELESTAQDFFFSLDQTRSMICDNLSKCEKKLGACSIRSNLLKKHLSNTSAVVKDILSVLGKNYSEKMLENLKNILDATYKLQMDVKNNNQRLKENEFLKSELEKSKLQVISLEVKNSELKERMESKSKDTEKLDMMQQISSLNKQIQAFSNKENQHNNESFLQSRIEKLEETKERLQSDINVKNNEIRELEKKLGGIELKLSQERWEKETAIDEKNRIQTGFTSVTEQLSQVESDNLKQLEELLSLKTLITNLKNGMDSVVGEMSNELKKFQVDLPQANSSNFVEDIFLHLKRTSKSVLDFVEQVCGEKEVLRGELYAQLSQSYSKQKGQEESRSRDLKELSNKVLNLNAQLSIKDSELTSLRSKFDSLHTVCETYEDNYKQMEVYYNREREEVFKYKAIVDDLKEKIRICSLEYMDIRSLFDTLSCDLAEVKEDNESLLGELEVYTFQLKEKTDTTYFLASVLDEEIVNTNKIKELTETSENIISEIQRIIQDDSNNTKSFRKPETKPEIIQLSSLEFLDDDIFSSIPTIEEDSHESALSLREDGEKLRKFVQTWSLSKVRIINSLTKSIENGSALKTTLENLLRKKKEYSTELENDIEYMKKNLKDLLSHLSSSFLSQTFK